MAGPGARYVRAIIFPEGGVEGGVILYLPKVCAMGPPVAHGKTKSSFACYTRALPNSASVVAHAG